MTVYYALSGDPFQANTFDNGRQDLPVIAARPDGSYVVVWESFQQDSDREGIHFRIFGADDQPLTGEIMANEVEAGIQSDPQIAVGADGSFVIVWTSFGVDGSITGIAARNFSAAGTPLGSEFVVNTHTASAQNSPALAQLTSGANVVAWESFVFDGDNDAIAARFVAPNDTGDDDTLVNTTTTYNDSTPEIAATADGGYVVAWEDWRQLSQFSSEADIRAQRFDSGGNAVGMEFVVNTTTTRHQDQVDLAGLTGGGFVAAWASNVIAGTGAPTGLVAQVFDAAGGKVGSEFEIFQQGSGVLAQPELIGLSDGGFAALWFSAGQFANGQVVVPGGYYMRFFDASGTPSGDEFLVTDDRNTRALPAELTELASGDLMVTWFSGSGDADGADIMVQRVGRFGEIEGTAQADLLRGADGADRISGLGGNDTLLGGDGTDTLIGGGGDDSIVGGATDADLRDVVFAGDGNDTIEGGAGNDELRGDAGNDDIAGGAGADTVIGGAGDDVMTGSNFGDVIFGGDGFDFINGGFGNDRVNGGNDADRFFHVGVAGHGSDWIQDYDASEGDVLLYGGSATIDQFQVNRANTANAGEASVDEAFVIYKPTGQILWALVDGFGNDAINIRIGGVEYDLLG